MTIAMITHGVPGDSFWDLIRKGAVDQTGDHTANAALRHPTVLLGNALLSAAWLGVLAMVKA